MCTVNNEDTTRPFIYEKDGTLSLHFGMGGDVQSIMRVDAPDLLALGYTRTMMSFLLFIERPKHIGIIGLGGGSIPKHCYRYLPDTQISVAEICPEIIALRDKFFIPNDDHRFKVFQEDGAEFVKRHRSQFDVLIVDGFDVAGQPEQLCSWNFYDDCYRALAREGILVVNLCDSFPQTSTRRVRQCFGTRVVAVGVEDSNNAIVCAGKGNIWRKSNDQLTRNRMHIKQHHAIDLSRTVQEVLVERKSCRPLQPTKGQEAVLSRADALRIKEYPACAH
jgi:spermidine synthase